jgi:hypothetical protein
MHGERGICLVFAMHVILVCMCGVELFLLEFLVILLLF